jgi:hypothetical protein
MRAQGGLITPPRDTSVVWQLFQGRGGLAAISVHTRGNRASSPAPRRFGKTLGAYAIYTTAHFRHAGLFWFGVLNAAVVVDQCSGDGLNYLRAQKLAR